MVFKNKYIPVFKSFGLILIKYFICNCKLTKCFTGITILICGIPTIFFAGKAISLLP